MPARERTHQKLVYNSAIGNIEAGFGSIETDSKISKKIVISQQLLTQSS
jgi:hypothetical protein